METAYVDRHIRSLCQAKICAELGARIKTIAYITGIAHNELVRLFFVDEHSAPRGRPPDSPEWYHQANLVEKVEASMFAAAFARLEALGFGPVDALIGSYRIYRTLCSQAPRISFDRAFDLVCSLKGIWARKQPQLAHHACHRCHSTYLIAVGDYSGNDCPFCKLVKRYSIDRRIQSLFPARALPGVSSNRFGLLAAFLPEDPGNASPNSAAPNSASPKVESPVK